jgi:DNA-binding transcriptional regulator YiaG
MLFEPTRATFGICRSKIGSSGANWCLTPVRPLTPEEIRELREREGASHAVFARYLNVSVACHADRELSQRP